MPCPGAAQSLDVSSVIMLMADAWSVCSGQVAQSCNMLEMHTDIKTAPGTADDYDFAIVGAQEAVAALRYILPPSCPSCPDPAAL